MQCAVCFSKGRLDLEKIDKINFRGRRLKNNQNLRQNEAVSELRSQGLLYVVCETKWNETKRNENL